MSGLTRDKGFSLVELLLVIVIIAILAGVVLLSMSSGDIVDAQTEARQLVRSIQSVRSSWLAYYADRNIMLGVPGSGTYAANSPLARSLEVYSDRPSVGDDITKYGGLIVRSVADGTGVRPLKIYIGYQGPWRLGAKSDVVMNSIRELLAGNDSGLLGNDYNKYASSGQTVLLRVK
ncbi:MAG: type II secretion system GspH family protein [Synergistaceae bacterium]|nr:type II secretion system GspH family protein [Synergistaceae bacterium]